MGSGEIDKKLSELDGSILFYFLAPLLAFRFSIDYNTGYLVSVFLVLLLIEIRELKKYIKQEANNEP